MKIKTINIIIIYSLFFSNTSYTMLKENDSSESVFKKNADEIGNHAHYILAYRKKNNLKKTLFYAMCGIITFFLSLKIKKNIEKGEPPFFNTSKFPFTFLKKIKLLEEYVINQISYYQKKDKFHIYQYTVIGIRYMIPILSIIIGNRHLKENNKIKQDYLKIFILLSKHCTEIIENQYKQANSNTKDNSNIKDNFSITYVIDNRWYNALRTLADYQKWHPLGLVYPCLKKIHDYYSDDRDINKLDYGWFRDFKVQKDGDTDATTDFEEMYKFIMQNLFNQTDSTEKRVEFSELFLHNESLYKKVKFSLIMHNIVLFVIIFILAYLIYQLNQIMQNIEEDGVKSLLGLRWLKESKFDFLFTIYIKCITNPATIFTLAQSLQTVIIPLCIAYIISTMLEGKEKIEFFYKINIFKFTYHPTFTNKENKSDFENFLKCQTLKQLFDKINNDKKKPIIN